MAVAFGVALVVHARSVNGAHGFPLDDAWIHLTYARNLVEQGTFAYFPGEPSTQGSTSPLFTALLAIGFLVTRDEKILGFTLGIAFQAAFAATLFAWARRRAGDVLWAGLAVGLVVLDPRAGILSVSGMETSLFLFLVALSFLAHASERRLLEGLAVGLAAWTRPEGVLLGAVLAIDRLVDRRRRAGAAQAEDSTARPWAGLIAAAVLIGGYVAFNLAVGGSPLPNTFAAKTAFYAVNSRWDFVSGTLRHAILDGPWLIAAPLWGAALALSAARLVRRREDTTRAEAGFAVGTVLAYIAVLPFAHRFDRYLVPVLPALAVMAARAGSAAAVAATAHGGARRRNLFHAAVVVAAVAFAWQAARSASAFDEYASACKYHLDRHEKTGRWLAGHTPPDAVIAAHDVGAIAFYSRRRVVDTVGVVRPEAVRHLNEPGYLGYLQEMFGRERVSHLAVLRNWLEVSNVEPYFVADPTPEILEVYPWVPGRTHLMPRAASRLNEAGSLRLQSGDPEGAADAFRRSLGVDPQSARTRLLLGGVFETERRFADAERTYVDGLALEPASPDLGFRLAVVLAAEGRRDEAIERIRAVLRDHPEHPRALELYRALGGS